LKFEHVKVRNGPPHTHPELSWAELRERERERERRRLKTINKEEKIMSFS
jgi:hypothetical protein